MDSDPTTGELEREFPGWRVWQGMDGFVYAQAPPPAAAVYRDENTTELRAKVKALIRTGEAVYGTS